jgi:hypothetical protein
LRFFFWLGISYCDASWGDGFDLLLMVRLIFGVILFLEG